MDTGALKKFAQSARRQLREQVAARLEHVLRADTAELREKQGAIAELRDQIKQSSKAAVIDRVAYTWFNRFCALRYMDVNHYTRVGVVSPLEGFTQPEILQEAKQGLIDPDLPVSRQRVLDLLSGKLPSSNPQQEAYRLLLVATCNAYYKIMPFMFEKIEDYTELLMPEDLLSENSILHSMRQALNEANCQDVEVIGWLYQFYISERKDEVFENLKKNIKIEAEDIPAATQLFTPHWIVCYLVENSLGRLWMLNHPDSPLVRQLDYYIKPVQEETDFLRIESPEDLKICDPACGSGHMLNYAFDLLYAIYEESGYDPVQIPRLILENNLYGIEIDERAGALAAFSMFMKARGRDRRFFSLCVQPRICILENVTFSSQELKEYMGVMGSDLFTEPLFETLRQFEQADNFGSLIVPVLTDISYLRIVLETKNLIGDIFLHEIHRRVLKVLRMAEYLSPRYQILIANPPYMNTGNMNDELREFVQDRYVTSKSNLYTIFIERNLNMAGIRGLVAMITLEGWMFKAAYKNFREMLFREGNILTLAHLGAKAFDSIGGEVVSTAAFVHQKSKVNNGNGVYFNITNGNNESEKSRKLRSSIYALRNGLIEENTHIASFPDISVTDNKSLLYWITNSIRNVFTNNKPLDSVLETREGLTTGSNDLFLRYWYEVSLSEICMNSAPSDNCIKKKWFRYVKGGTFRRWSGNFEFLVDWEDDGKRIRNFADPATGRIRSHNYNGEYGFNEGLTWSMMASGAFGVRHVPAGFMFDTASPMGFPKQSTYLKEIISFLNSSISYKIMSLLNPTMEIKLGHVLSLPYVSPIPPKVNELCNDAISISKDDWDSFETSWDYQYSPLLSDTLETVFLSEAYDDKRAHWLQITQSLQDLEEENNRIFIEAYGLQDEMIPKVLVNEITLTCNPYYRYGTNNCNEELEALLRADTMKEFISYTVGCMFGRYSLDKSGLILANQGETVEDYHRQIPNPTFPPDEDNVIPILDEGWFADDITERLKKFLRITFGEEYYKENLKFLEEAIGKDVRSYFLKDFYNEHLKMYKKRPIYWLFSSPGGSFNALIYMHRYRPDTVSVVLSYLREYIQKLHAYKAHQEQVSITFGASQSEKTKALKEVNRMNKVLAELKEYEDEVLYPLATQRIQIDLDDGVKVNYVKFGKALRKISGLSD
jgi:hypothetical protein